MRLITSSNSVMMKWWLMKLINVLARHWPKCHPRPITPELQSSITKLSFVHILRTGNRPWLQYSRLSQNLMTHIGGTTTQKEWFLHVSTTFRKQSPHSLKRLIFLKAQGLNVFSSDQSVYRSKPEAIKPFTTSNSTLVTYLSIIASSQTWGLGRSYVCGTIALLEWSIWGCFNSVWAQRNSLISIKLWYLPYIGKNSLSHR